jgi:hypothetical protein
MGRGWGQEKGRVRGWGWETGRERGEEKGRVTGWGWERGMGMGWGLRLDLVKERPPGARLKGTQQTTCIVPCWHSC